MFTCRERLRALVRGIGEYGGLSAPEKVERDPHAKRELLKAILANLVESFLARAIVDDIGESNECVSVEEAILLEGYRHAAVFGHVGRLSALAWEMGRR